ncbi:MAG: hypothetical protein ACJ8MH_03285 [Povalibacter sp.]|jgi:hypothetical protein
MEASELMVGRAYFACGYFFRNRPVPEIETWIYVGSEKSDVAESTVHRFQDPATYYWEEWAEVVSEGERVESVETQQMLVEEENLGLIYTLRELEDFVAGLRSEPNADEAFLL